MSVFTSDVVGVCRDNTRQRRRSGPSVIRVASLLLLTMSLGAQAQEAVTDTNGATLRALDKLSGKVTDMQLSKGEHMTLGHIDVELDDCRYPEGNPAGDAYAFVTIREYDKPDPIFRGWMVASAPALNAMDHARYDVWVMRCQTF